MPELTAEDLAVQIGIWLAQSRPTLEYTREARQEIVLWSQKNISKVATRWSDYKWTLRTGVHAMADRLALAGVERYCHVVTDERMRDGITWLETSGTIFCPKKTTATASFSPFD